MRKQIIDLRIVEATRPREGFVCLKAEPQGGVLPECRPGQFAQLRTGGAMLRRPISIHNVDGGQVWFLIQTVGEGTRWFQTLRPGDLLNAVMPLGNGFSVPEASSERGEARVLLVGGGVGVAPLLFQGRVLRERGIDVAFLLGAWTRDMLLQLEEFRRVAPVYVITEDGSEGERGFVTGHSVLRGVGGEWRVESGERKVESGEKVAFSLLPTCGPTPMMRAVARYARERGIPCEVSLENRMACGVGACLCCVQQTKEGHKCVCTDGPVFDARLIVDN